MRYLRLYAKFVRLGALTLAQYRLNALVWLVFGSVWYSSSVFIVWVMFYQFPVLAGWTFPDMFFLYALWALAHAIYWATFAKAGGLPSKVQDGSFDGILVRPLGALFQLVAEPAWGPFFDLVVAIPLFVVAQHVAGIQWTWGNLALFPALLVGGVLIESAINLVLTTLSFWTVRLERAQGLLGQMELEFVRFPLTIYAQPVQRLFTFVIPLAFIAFLPAQLLLNKTNSSSFLHPALGYWTPVVGGITFTLAYTFWRWGLRHYQSTGS